MKKHDETATSRYPRGLPAISRFFLILLIFCFAGCAAGSCLSYGHSCWGAHGKRSYDGPRVSEHRQIDTREDGRQLAEVEMDGNSDAMNSQNRWFLSRLITGKLAVPAASSIIGKHSGNRWHEGKNIVALPGNWENDYEKARNVIFRNEKAEIDESIGDAKELDDRLDLTQKITKPHEESTELLFVPSRKEYINNHPSHTPKLRLYKILTDSSSDYTF